MQSQLKLLDVLFTCYRYKSTKHSIDQFFNAKLVVTEDIAEMLATNMKFTSKETQPHYLTKMISQMVFYN